MYNLHTYYQAYIESFPLSTERVGIFKPGRYCGYDTIIPRTGVGAGIHLTLTHQLTGIAASGSDNELEAVSGVLISPHGTIIKTTDEIPLTVSSSPTDNKIYLVYMEFVWESEYPGGTPFVSLQLCPLAGGEDCQLSVPRIQVLIGKLRVAAGATDISGVTYTYERVPSLGGASILENYPELSTEFARLKFSNTFTGTQSFGFKSLNLQLSNYRIVLPDTGNTFRLNCGIYNGRIDGILKSPGVPFPVGTELTLEFQNVGAGAYLNLSSLASGYKFELGPGNLMSNPTDQKFPLRNGSIVKVYNRGLLGGEYAYVIISAPGYFNDSMFYLKTLIAQAQAQINPVWYKVDEEEGTGLYKYTASFTADGIETPLSYRLNAQGNLEIMGGFNQPATIYSPDQLPVKVCNIPASYVPKTSNTQGFALNAFKWYPVLGPGPKSLESVPLMLHSDGSIYINYGSAKKVYVNTILPKVIFYDLEPIQGEDPGLGIE